MANLQSNVFREKIRLEGVDKNTLIRRILDLFTYKQICYKIDNCCYSINIADYKPVGIWTNDDKEELQQEENFKFFILFKDDNKDKESTLKDGSAVSFDGDNDYIDIGNGSCFNFENGFTIEGWIKLNSLPESKDNYALSFDGNNDYVYIDNNEDVSVDGTEFAIDFWIKPQNMPEQSNGYSLYFDGYQDFVELKNDVDLNLGNQFAIEGWIKPDFNRDVISDVEFIREYSALHFDGHSNYAKIENPVDNSLDFNHNYFSIEAWLQPYKSESLQPYESESLYKVGNSLYFSESNPFVEIHRGKYNESNKSYDMYFGEDKQFVQKQGYEYNGYIYMPDFCFLDKCIYNISSDSDHPSLFFDFWLKIGSWPVDDPNEKVIISKPGQYMIFLRKETYNTARIGIVAYPPGDPTTHELDVYPVLSNDTISFYSFSHIAIEITKKSDPSIIFCLAINGKIVGAVERSCDSPSNNIVYDLGSDKVNGFDYSTLGGSYPRSYRNIPIDINRSKQPLLIGASDAFRNFPDRRVIDSPSNDTSFIESYYGPLSSGSNAPIYDPHYFLGYMSVVRIYHKELNNNEIANETTGIKNGNAFSGNYNQSAGWSFTNPTISTPTFKVDNGVSGSPDAYFSVPALQEPDTSKFYWQTIGTKQCLFFGKNIEGNYGQVCGIYSDYPPIKIGGYYNHIDSKYNDIYNYLMIENDESISMRHGANSAITFLFYVHPYEKTDDIDCNHTSTNSYFTAIDSTKDFFALGVKIGDAIIIRSSSPTEEVRYVGRIIDSHTLAWDDGEQDALNIPIANGDAFTIRHDPAGVKDIEMCGTLASKSLYPLYNENDGTRQGDGKFINNGTRNAYDVEGVPFYEYRIMIGRHHDNQFKYHLGFEISIGSVNYFFRTEIDIEDDSGSNINGSLDKYYIYPDSNSVPGSGWFLVGVSYNFNSGNVHFTITRRLNSSQVRIIRKQGLNVINVTWQAYHGTIRNDNRKRIQMSEFDNTLDSGETGINDGYPLIIGGPNKYPEQCSNFYLDELRIIKTNSASSDNYFIDMSESNAPVSFFEDYVSKTYNNGIGFYGFNDMFYGKEWEYFPAFQNVCLLHFDEKYGSYAIDYSGNQNHGKINGGISPLRFPFFTRPVSIGSPGSGELKYNTEIINHPNFPGVCSFKLNCPEQYYDNYAYTMLDKIIYTSQNSIVSQSQEENVFDLSNTNNICFLMSALIYIPSYIIDNSSYSPTYTSGGAGLFFGKDVDPNVIVPGTVYPVMYGLYLLNDQNSSDPSWTTPVLILRLNCPKYNENNKFYWIKIINNRDTTKETDDQYVSLYKNCWVNLQVKLYKDISDNHYKIEFYLWDTPLSEIVAEDPFGDSTDPSDGAAGPIRTYKLYSSSNNIVSSLVLEEEFLGKPVDLGDTINFVDPNINNDQLNFANFMGFISELKMYKDTNASGNPNDLVLHYKFNKSYIFNDENKVIGQKEKYNDYFDIFDESGKENNAYMTFHWDNTDYGINVHRFATGQIFNGSRYSFINKWTGYNQLTRTINDKTFFVDICNLNKLQCLDIKVQRENNSGNDIPYSRYLFFNNPIDYHRYLSTTPFYFNPSSRKIFIDIELSKKIIINGRKATTSDVSNPWFSSLLTIGENYTIFGHLDIYDHSLEAVYSYPMYSINFAIKNNDIYFSVENNFPVDFASWNANNGLIVKMSIDGDYLIIEDISTSSTESEDFIDEVHLFYSFVDNEYIFNDHWNHLAIIYDQNNDDDIQVYVNNNILDNTLNIKLENTFNDSNIVQNSETNILIGASDFYNDNNLDETYNYYDGLISLLRVYDYSLDLDDVNNLYNSGNGIKYLDESTLTDLNNNCIGEWLFIESDYYTALDTSTNNNNIFIINSSVIVNNGFNNEDTYYFDGNLNYIKVEHDFPISNSVDEDDFTLSFWIKPNILNNENYYRSTILSKSHDYYGGYYGNLGYRIYLQGSNLENKTANLVCEYYNSNFYPINLSYIVGTVLCDGKTWSHIVVKFDSDENEPGLNSEFEPIDGKFQIYINGERKIPFILSENSVDYDLYYKCMPILIGAEYKYPLFTPYATETSTINNFDGQITQIRIYNDILTNEEILSEYNEGNLKNISNDNPLNIVLSYEARYTEGNTFDESFYYNNGLVYRDVNWTLGMFDNLYSDVLFVGDTFNIISKYIYNGEDDQKSFKVELANNDPQKILRAGIYNESNSCIYEVDISSVIESTYNDQDWIHFMCSYDSTAGAGNQWKFFINNVVMANSIIDDDVVSSPLDNNIPILIGAEHLNDYYLPTCKINRFMGNIDNLRIWKTNGHLSDVDNLYNLGVGFHGTGLENNLISFWDFDDGFGNQANDFSGYNNNHGSLSPYNLNHVFHFAPPKYVKVFEDNYCVRFDGIDDYIIADEIDMSDADAFAVKFKVKLNSFPGALGNALNCNGENIYCEVVNGVDIVLGEVFTIEGWIYLDSEYVNDIMTIISKYDESSIMIDNMWRIDVRKNLFGEYKLRSTLGNCIFESATSLSLNTWYHFVVVYDKNATSDLLFRIYINSSLDNSLSDFNIISNVEEIASANNVDVIIGAVTKEKDVRPTSEPDGWSYYEQYGDFFGGRIDELRIYISALNRVDIKNSYNNGKGTYGSIENCDLLAGWHFDNVFHDNIVYDYSLNQYNLNVREGDSVPSSSNVRIDGIAPQDPRNQKYVVVGQHHGDPDIIKYSDPLCLSFNGYNSYCLIENFHLNDYINDFSISFWMYGNDVNASFGDIYHDDYGTILCSGSNNMIRIYYDWGNEILYFKISNTNIGFIENVSANKWHHICIIYDSSYIASVYLDNIFSFSWPMSPLSIITFDLIIGAQSYEYIHNYFQGQIDELIFYNKALSISELSDLYNNGYGKYELASKNPNIIAGYHFDEGEGVTITDFSGNELNGYNNNAIYVNSIIESIVYEEIDDYNEWKIEIVNRKNEEGNIPQIRCIIEDDNGNYCASRASIADISEGNSWSIDEWYEFTVVYNKNEDYRQKWKIYNGSNDLHDNIEVEYDYPVEVNKTNMELYVGAQYDEIDDDIRFHLNGYLDYIQIYSDNFTNNTEVFNDSTDGSTIPITLGMFLDWNFNEGSGITVIDVTYNGNDGILSTDGGVLSSPEWQNGHVTGRPDYQSIINQYSDDNKYGYRIDIANIDGDVSLRCLVRNNDNVCAYYGGEINYDSDLEWQHIAIKYNSGDVNKIQFKNNNILSSFIIIESDDVVDLNDFDLYNNENIFIGIYNDYTCDLNAHLDEFRLYNNSCSFDHVVDLYNSGYGYYGNYYSDIFSSGQLLIGCHFDEGIGSNINNYAENKIHAIKSNCNWIIGKVKEHEIYTIISKYILDDVSKQQYKIELQNIPGTSNEVKFNLYNIADDLSVDLYQSNSISLNDYDEWTHIAFVYDYTDTIRWKFYKNSIEQILTQITNSTSYQQNTDVNVILGAQYISENEVEYIEDIHIGINNENQLIGTINFEIDENLNTNLETIIVFIRPDTDNIMAYALNISNNIITLNGNFNIKNGDTFRIIKNDDYNNYKNNYLINFAHFDLDEFNIHNLALTNSNIISIYNNGYGIYGNDYENLIAGYHFDEYVGNIAYDYSSNNCNGTLYGPSWIYGKIVLIHNILPSFNFSCNNLGLTWSGPGNEYLTSEYNPFDGMVDSPILKNNLWIGVGISFDNETNGYFDVNILSEHDVSTNFEDRTNVDTYITQAKEIIISYLENGIYEK